MLPLSLPARQMDVCQMLPKMPVILETFSIEWASLTEKSLRLSVEVMLLEGATKIGLGSMDPGPLSPPPSLIGFSLNSLEMTGNPDNGTDPNNSRTDKRKIL